ncbi:MAG: hypothetical protein WA952_19060 [Lewinella sp.]
MLFALPIIYVAASLYNGEDPVANVKGWFGMTDGQAAEERYEEPGRDRTEQTVDLRELESLRAENERLQEALDRCQGTSGS